MWAIPKHTVNADLKPKKVPLRWVFGRFTHNDSETEPGSKQRINNLNVSEDSRVFGKEKKRERDKIKNMRPRLYRVIG